MGTLGFELGAPLWGKHFESIALRSILIQSWPEPGLSESVSKTERVAALKAWIEAMESRNPLVCAKHPLLCLAVNNLVEAWGGDLKIIRAARPIDHSIIGLRERKWFQGHEVRMQRKLDSCSDLFLSTHEHLSVEHGNLVQDPETEIRKVLRYLDLSRSDEEIRAAAGLVRRGKRP